MEQINPMLPINTSCYVAGTVVNSNKKLDVHNPYDGSLVGTINIASSADADQAISIALQGGKQLTRFERYTILEKARQFLV